MSSVIIASVQFANVFLRMDGSGVTHGTGTGGGRVNCQFAAGPWERYHLVGQPDGTFAIASDAFTGVYLRMDGSGVTQPTGSGGGRVNCQFGVGAWEKFYVVPQGAGTIAFVSQAFPNVCLRMDGSGVTQPSAAGGGTVNCQLGAGPWEKFKIVVQ